MSSATHGATPLARKLAARILSDGPLSVARYMHACLHDPEHGYYRKHRAIGREGDFITAPEISQVFGELVGLCCAVIWQQMGEPHKLRLIELGPGRGTLMRDALRAARAVPAFHAALSVDLVETNAALTTLQRATLADAGVPVRWSTEIEMRADDRPALVIANEFLDTLPVAQWVSRPGGWRPRCVALDPEGRLTFAEAAAVAQPDVPAGVVPPYRDGGVLELRTEAFDALAARLAGLGDTFAALFIDYGHTQSAFGDTLQAVRAHGYDDPLAAPGEADVTAQVDFAAFAARMTAHGLACDGPVTQAEFLGALGIVERASRLMAANPDRAAAIETAVARLMAPGGMGTRFHAIGVRSNTVPPLPGLRRVDSWANAP